MRNRSGEKIKLSGIDELLGVVNEESAMEIDIASIHPFAGHPFKVIDDDKMQDLVESVRENGVITPVLIRPAMENQYEMISGHRRMHAAKLAGLSNIPAIVREMTDDEAVIAMVDANIQREELLPSEKAFLIGVLVCYQDWIQAGILITLYLILFALLFVGTAVEVILEEIRSRVMGFILS